MDDTDYDDLYDEAMSDQKLSDEEIELLKEAQYNQPISMESLGMTWKDFL